MSNIIVFDKKCLCCGKDHTHLPDQVQESEGLFYFQCDCKSTLAVPVAKVEIGGLIRMFPIMVDPLWNVGMVPTWSYSSKSDPRWNFSGRDEDFHNALAVRIKSLGAKPPQDLVFEGVVLDQI